ncbi:hypothetical protein HMPREF2141_01966 [Bacteroides uniformis]|nr:hypothetical protein HMPREF2141_01966 [Bacteroides uniformis]
MFRDTGNGSRFSAYSETIKQYEKIKSKRPRTLCIRREGSRTVCPAGC